MTIASEITRINNNIADAYTACNGKGATLPLTQNSANLATCISSIPSGGGGGGTTYSYPELKGGNYYVLDDETVTPVYFDDCSISGRSSVGTLVEMQGSIAMVYYDNDWSGQGYPPLTSNATLTGGDIFGNVHVKHISLNGFPSSNYKIGLGNTAFNEAEAITSYLTSVCISSMKNITQIYFGQCTYLSEVDVSSIDYLPSRAFYGSAAAGGAFAYTEVQTLSFNSLNSNSFGSYTDQFNNMLKGVIGCTVHFPSNLQSVIGSWTSVTSGFGGTNTTVLFDLPATT